MAKPSNSTSEKTTSETSGVDPTTLEAQGYWEIVWEQFRKYKMSYIALWMCVILILLAVYAPVLASDLPFVMTIDGEMTFPWLANTFNKNYFENTVDIFFNSLMFLIPLGGIYYFLRMKAASGLSKRLQRARKARVIGQIVLGIMAANAWLLIDPASQVVDNRPESSAAHVFGWYQSEFPQSKLELETAEKEGKDTMAILAPIEFSFRTTSQDLGATYSAEHPLGTDNIGRDISARMLFGTRIALTIGVVAVGIYITIGIILGALAGYFGGWVDLSILRFIEIMMCFPSLFLIMTLAAFVDEPSVFYVMLIIGVTRWTGPARLVRGEFLRLRNEEFVQAAKALGLPEWRIIFRHILPNALGPVLVNATFGVASAILVESTISFLGLGDPAAPTWGQMLNDGRVVRNNVMILLPGFAIFVTVSLFNLLGEGLRDALDPKMRR